MFSFLLTWPTIEHMVDMSVGLDAMMLMWHHYNGNGKLLQFYSYLIDIWL